MGEERLDYNGLGYYTGYVKDLVNKKSNEISDELIKAEKSYEPITKNLCSAIEGGITLTTANQLITAMYLDSGDYTLSFSCDSSIKSQYTIESVEDDMSPNGKLSSGDGLIDVVQGSNVRKFHLSGLSFIAIRATEETEVYNMQIETGNTASEYEEYIESLRTLTTDITLLQKENKDVSGEISELEKNMQNMNTALSGKANSSHTHTKSQITDFPTSMPANGGNSTTVNGHTVNSDVPANAKFTDTTYNIATTTANGLMSKEHVSKLNNIQNDALGLKYIYNAGKSDYGISSTGGTSANNSSVASNYFMLNAKDGGKTGMIQFTQPFDFRKSSRLLYNVSYYNSGALNQVRVYLGTSAGKNDLMSFDIPLTTGINSFSLPDSVKTRTETYVSFVCNIVSGNTGDIRFNQVYVDNLYQNCFDKSNKTEDFYFMKYYDYLQDPSKNLFVKSTNINDKIESNGRGFTRTTDEPALLIKIRYDNASTGNYWTGFGILAKTKYGCITGTQGNAYSNIDTTDIAVETTPNGNTVYVSHMASAWTNNNYPCTITTTNGTIKSISEPVYYLGTTTNKNKLNKFILAVADYLLFDSNDVLPILNSFSKNNLSAYAITTSQLTVTDISHYINDKSLYFKTGNGEAGFINYSTIYTTIYSSGDTTKTGVVGFHVGNSAYNTRLEGDYLYLYGGTMLSANTTLRTGSDEKVKVFTNDIESDNDNLIKLFDIINPKTYKYRYLTNDKLNIGFSAQEVESAFLELGIKPEKYNILNISYNHMLNRGSDEEDCKYYTKFMSIAYSDLHNLAILKIKDMEERHTERLNSLENKLEMLEDKLGGVS